MSDSSALIQGSAEWVAARIGKATASRMADVLAKTKSGYGASRGNYLAELIAERLTGVPAEKFTNPAMAWGSEKEPDARIAYEFMTNATVVQVGFIDHPTIPMSGASPDGCVDDDGLVECKCPNTATHIETLLGQKIPEKYVSQMFWQMACTGRKWCDFVSFDPRMPSEMQLFIQRLHRDDARIAEIEQEVCAFLSELDTKLRLLKGRMSPALEYLRA